MPAVRVKSLAQLHARVAACDRCARLRTYCGEIARQKRRAFAQWDYWGKPVPGFGDPDAWQPITFTRPNGEKFTPGYLTPHWGNGKTLALESSDQCRPPGPPKVSDPQLKLEVDECIRYNANLTDHQRAIVEFMRDGPRSTGQSGHWLRFAADVSRMNSTIAFCSRLSPAL